jgi:Ca-activated chloride channel family protein
MTLTARTDRRLIRHSGGSVRYVLLETTAPTMERTRERPPAHLAFVIDRSGSMAGRKLELAKSAVQSALARLDERDHFAIVAYDDTVEVVVGSTSASEEAKSLGLTRLASVDARGSTDLAAGWLRGCEQVAVGLVPDAVGRCLLLTDGLANKGITDPQVLRTHAEELRARHVVTSTFGVGADFDEVLLQSVADTGGGHFYYIESAPQIPDLITSEVGEALEVVARDAAIAAHTPDVLVEPLSALPFRRAGEATLVQLGELVSGQQVEIVLKLTFPPGEAGMERAVTFRLTDRDGVLGGASATVAWQHAGHTANDAQPRDRDIDRRVAALYAARAREAAAAFNRRGQWEAARHALQSVAGRIRGYAGSDPLLLGLVAELSHDQIAFSAPMAPAALKTRHFQTHAMLRDRDFEGKARKST